MQAFPEVTSSENLILCLDSSSSDSDPWSVEVLPVPPSSSLTPAGRPTLSLDLDTMYLDVASDSQALSLARPPHSPLQRSSQAQVVSCASE